jgi:hypothetical protein
MAADVKTTDAKTLNGKELAIKVDAGKRAESHIADYDRTSGKFLRLLETIQGKQPGDPDKAAEAIIAAVETDRPPLRLVLGKYANDKVRKKLILMESELAAWAHAGLPTDFPATLQNA